MEFRKNIIKEIHDHCKRNHWEMIEREKVPEYCEVLSATWSMKRKLDLVRRGPVK